MFNKRAKLLKTKMDNGNTGFKDSKDFALFMSMLNFKPRNSFYTSCAENLERIEKLIDALPTEEVIAIAWFLGTKMGMRLSPTIALTRKAKSTASGEIRLRLKFAVREVFTRPDFIANSIGYMNHSYGLEMKDIPTWLKRTFKSCLEGMKDITLTKRRMDNKGIKLKDLIKVLRPNPMKAVVKDKDIYKKIIEGNLALLLNEEDQVTQSITATLSNDTIRTEKKQEIIANSLQNMAINEIIRNISNIEPTYDNLNIVSGKIVGILKREDSLRFLNPFDLIVEDKYIASEWITLFDTILEDYVKESIGSYGETTVLFDVSGSMHHRTDKALKFLALFRPVMDAGMEIEWFSAKHWQDAEAQKIIKNAKTPNEFYRKLSDFISKTTDKRWWGCTHLITTLTEMKYKAKKNIIIITDEFTYDNTSALGRVSAVTQGRNVILYNVDYSTTSAFSITSGILRCTGYDGKIIPMLPIFGNFKGFKAIIMKQFEEAFNKNKGK